MSSLEEFMRKHIPSAELIKAGFFTKEMKGDYEAQAKRICKFFGYNSIYEYGSETIRCHLTFDRTHWVDKEGEFQTEPFITEIKPHNFFEL